MPRVGFMNLHEYQAKEIFSRFGIPVPSGLVARSSVEAVAAAERLGGSTWVVKAQIHAGGRGKAGGVEVCRSPAAVGEVAGRLIGQRLKTHQTGPEGLPVHAVWVEEASDIGRELYLSLVVDRARECLSFIASSEGGMEIETVAATDPEKIATVPLPPDPGVPAYVTRILGGVFRMAPQQLTALSSLLSGLERCMRESDASLIEINPLIVTRGGELRALDAKVNLDDNALGRHVELAALDDPSQRDPAENEATQAGLNYVALEGDIACMVNGAGLAMATMDLIQLKGGQPANFLDVGGDATAARVTEAFRIFRANPRVRSIFVNIFGGIVRCDLIAEGIIAAFKEVAPDVPVIVQLEGTRAEEGRRMFVESRLPIETASGLTHAAERAVRAAGGAA